MDCPPRCIGWTGGWTDRPLAGRRWTSAEPDHTLASMLPADVDWNEKWICSLVEGAASMID